MDILQADRFGTKLPQNQGTTVFRFNFNQLLFNSGFVNCVFRSREFLRRPELEEGQKQIFHLFSLSSNVTQLVSNLASLKKTAS